MSKVMIEIDEKMGIINFIPVKNKNENKKGSNNYEK